MSNNEDQDDLFLIHVSYKEMREFIYESADIISLVKSILEELNHPSQSQQSMGKFKKPLEKAVITLEGHIQQWITLFFQPFKADSPNFRFL